MISTTTLYLDGYQYVNGNLEFFPVARAYVKKTENIGATKRWYDYVFNYTDHLGNIRLSYTFDYNTNKIKILEENHYYPFGLKHRKYNNLLSDIKFKPNISNRGLTPIVKGKTYKYKYQGQERQDELGLNWDSFKWRNYDFAIGRFMSVDPLTEEYRDWSPYVFSGNRVIDARELEGLEPYTVHSTEQAAAQNFGEYYNGASIIRGREYGSTIYSQTNTVTTPIGAIPVTTYSYNEASQGTAAGTAVNPDIPTGSISTADIHSHCEYLPTYDNNNFSGLHSTDNTLSTTGDIGDNNRTGLTGYVTTPDGSLQQYAPSTGTVTVLSTDLESDPNDPDRLNTNTPVDNIAIQERQAIEDINNALENITLE